MTDQPDLQASDVVVDLRDYRSSKDPLPVTFHRRELDAILWVYGRMVGEGEWRDYAIDHMKDKAVFSVFKRSGEIPLFRIEKNPKLASIVARYTRETLEQDAGADNTGVRLALYFERMAPSITSGYSIIADDAIAQVVRTALQLPAEFAATDIDRQAAYYEDVLKLDEFKDPSKVGKFLERFTSMWELENPTGASDSLAAFQPSGLIGISTDLLLSINNLKLGGR